MKKIVCELCESTSFVKEGGMFVCQGCGTSYSVEEARNMMREVDGDAPVSAPVSMPQVNPNQQQLDNILVLATSAYEADNKKEAENYCNRAIELDAMCYKAWFLKAKAVGWQSKVDDLRIEEAAHSFCKAIDFAPEEEKEDLKSQAVQELKSLGIALITLRKNRFSGSPDKEELNGFRTAKKVLLDSLLVLLSHGNVVGMPEGYLEEVATLMNQAGVAALNMARNAWKKVDHPSEKDFDTYLEWNGNISQVFRDAIETSDEDDEADIVRYKNLIISLEEPMTVDACSYKREWSSYRSEYIWVREYSLADSAKAHRRNEVKQCKEKIAAIEKKIAEKKAAEKKAAEEAKQQRIKAYWEAHAEEKAKLDQEKADLEAKHTSINAQIADLEKQIHAAETAGRAPVPTEAEVNEVKGQIKELDDRRSKLGIFAGKEKKQLSEQIASLQGRLDSLNARVEEEKQAQAQKTAETVAPLRDQKGKLIEERAAAGKRINAIDEILAKDPEE